MKVVYVAGPFRCLNPATNRMDAWGIHLNVIEAMRWSLEIWKRGAVALCPHANSMFYQDATGIIDDHIWLDGDLELIRRCDAVFMVPGWERSTGATAEKAFADALDIPVFDYLDSLFKWIEVHP